MSYQTNARPNSFCSDDNTKLFAKVEPLLFEGVFDVDNIKAFIVNHDAQNEVESSLSNFTLHHDSIVKLSDEIAVAIAKNKQDALEQIIGDCSHASVSISISDDYMSAAMSITKHSPNSIPSLSELESQIVKAGIVKGFSAKRLHMLLKQVGSAQLGDEKTLVIAKGLPPRNGKDSWIKPLVPNALERILKPQKNKHDNKVDMRNLGDIICVEKNTVVAKRIPPSTGRSGMNVLGQAIAPTPGAWHNIVIGVNTALQPDSENTIIATVAGLPKFADGFMSIDDIFVAPNGVNVGSGNINYDGAVIVTGDVTENMEVIAKGDITINGFVESAYIHAGGDIIITQGATGKVQHEDCQLIAGGSVYIEHAQGLDILVGKDLNVAKQLAHSRVKAKGSVTVGNTDNPMGNLFASTINCGKGVEAGSIGAISGSALRIDFSDGYKQLCDIYSALLGLFNQLTMTNTSHEIKLSDAKSKDVLGVFEKKLEALDNKLEEERSLLHWLSGALEEALANKHNYEINARVIANKELFPGVTVKLNNKLWRGTQEYQQCQITLQEANWECNPVLK